MDKRKLDEMNERDFVVACIMSDKIISTLAPYIQSRYFETKYTRLVIGWVVDYYKQFNSAPKSDVMSLYRMHCSEIEEGLQDTVLIFLHKLSENAEKFSSNDDFLLDRARDFLEFRKLTNYIEDIDACLELRDIKKAMKIQNGYKEVEIIKPNETSLFEKESLVDLETALTEQREELIHLPQALSRVYGPICREDFVDIMAKQKGGKTFAMIDLCTRAVIQGKKGLFFSLEMPKGQTQRRFWNNLFGAHSIGVEDGHVEETAELVKHGDEYFIEPKIIKVTHSETESVEKQQQRMRKLCRGGELKIIAYPMNSCTSEMIEDDIIRHIDDGFVPDFICVDYADIMLCKGNGEEYIQLDSIYKELRALAQKYHILVITATQTNRSGLHGNGDVDSIAGSARKLGHITSLVRIEQTPKMRKMHVCKLVNGVVRDGTADGSCIFAQALGIGKFIFGEPIDSKMVNLDLNNETD